MPTTKLFRVERIPVSALRLASNNHRRLASKSHTFSGAAILVDDSNEVLSGYAAVMSARALGIERVVCARLTPATAAEGDAALVGMILQLGASEVAALREASFGFSDPDEEPNA
jgi:hypothetical protein